MKRTRHIILSIAGLLVCGLMLGFSIDRSKDMRCTGFDVEVEGDGLLRFHDAEGLRESIQQREGILLGKAFADIDTHSIESMLEAYPHIAEAQVHRTLDGAVMVKVVQKNPLFRWVDALGNTGYVDTRGQWLPISDTYVHPCIPVTGAFEVPLVGTAAVEQEHVLHGIYEMLNYVSADEFWSAQILQIDVDADGSLVLIPRVGNHEILFGTAEAHLEKFNKLKTFYEKGISQTNWNLYRALDIRYEGQVVCTKR